MSQPLTWRARPETAQDAPAVRAVNLAAFPTSHEAELVDALRGDPAWIPGFSFVSTALDDAVAGFALLTRSWIDGVDALTLGPCAVLPEYQRSGAGEAVVRAAIARARASGETVILCLGHPEYYPRFGFRPASQWGIRAGFQVPDEAMMALPLVEGPMPSGVIRYPAPFGV